MATALKKERGETDVAVTGVSLCFKNFRSNIDSILVRQFIQVIPNCQAPKRRSRPYTREIACEQRLGVGKDGPGEAVESFSEVGSCWFPFW